MVKQYLDCSFVPVFRLVTYTTFLEGKAGDALQVRPRVRAANTWPSSGEVMPALLDVREHEVMKPSATGASVKVFWLTTPYSVIQPDRTHGFEGSTALPRTIAQ